MRKRNAFSRAVIVLSLLGLLFVGFPVGAPATTGGWPNLLDVVGGWFGPGSASAAPAAAPAKLRPPKPAQLRQASSVAAKPGAKPKRTRELDTKRTRSTKSYAMSDGTTQMELSTRPVHFKDGKGEWQEIDTEVVAGTGADSFRNTKNLFGSRFGKSTDRLVEFSDDDVSITLGAAGDGQQATPKADGSAVRFPDVFGTSDVRYRVSSEGLKEDIVLAAEDEVAEEYRFELRVKGVTAKRRPDGSIGFYRPKDDRPAYVMPAPFMYDASEQNKLGQSGFSEAVTQTLSRAGGSTVVSIKPDQQWLKAKGRQFPVVLDPSILISPEPSAAQDTMLSEASPSTNLGTNSTLNVGLNSNGKAYRSLLKFDLSAIPAGTDVRWADLFMHFASPFGSDANAVPLSAHEATAAWSESTATWASSSADYINAHSYNRVVVDDDDALSASYEGPWRLSELCCPTGGTATALTSGAAGDSFTWKGRVPTEGTYRVEAHYVPHSTRGVQTYSITGDQGTVTDTVDQTVGTAGSRLEVLTLGHHFKPGDTTQVKLTPQVGKTASADSVQFTEYAKQTKESGQRDTWHSFAVGSLVQDWAEGSKPNNGFLLKGTDDRPATGPVGGVFYNASENVYGDSWYYPKLVVTYGEPGPTNLPPSVVHASGAELNWTKYVDPTPQAEDDLAEYQVFRGCQTLPSGACDTPVNGDYFTPGQPGVTLVGSVHADTTSFTDETAVSSSATESAIYKHWIVARTVDDVNSGREGRAASNVQTVTIPREGRIRRYLSAYDTSTPADPPIPKVTDTTLSKSKPADKLDKPEGRAWMQVGNGHATYGEERALLKFDTTRIKEGVKVTDAGLDLYESGGTGTGTPTFNLHALTRPFVEADANWTQASATSNWTTAGGDFASTPLASVSTTNAPKRLSFSSAALQTKVQDWIKTPGDNNGFLLKAGDTAAQYLSIVSSESNDTLFQPRLYVEHLVKNDSQTFEANEIPERWVPGTIITTPVTVTNTSNTTWPIGLELSYRWTQPGSSEDITVPGDRRYVPLDRPLSPGESVKLELPIRAPINSDSGAKRLAYDLYLDLWDRPANEWFSTDNPPSTNTTRPTQGCAMMTNGLLCVDRYVEDPTSNQLGLEKFLSYTGEETGAGSQLLTNLYSGNVVWSYDAMSNPSMGPSTFLRLAYNSWDATDSGAGYGVSVQPATLNRLGTRLSVPSGGSTNNKMTFIDGDGTTHTYKLDTQTSTKLTYTRPAGVQLNLTRDLTAPLAEQWVFTRPDGTRFLFSQSTGLQTSVKDSNGNTLSYTYDSSERLTTVRDKSGRTTLTLGYDADGVEWIHDISGRALKFGYNDTHQLTKLEDGGGFNTATKTFADPARVKTFELGYTDTSVNTNARLNSVKDPRGATTRVTYFTSTENSTYALWPKLLTDRRANATTFEYSDPDSSEAKDLVAKVTDDNGATDPVTTYRMDGYGRTTSVIDANGKSTKLNWDSDHNVIRLQEPNDAVSTWEFSPVTGYPLTIRDAVAVEKDLPGVKLEYATKTGPGTPTVLEFKTSAGGRKDTFTYDDKGNLKTVRNELGHGPTYAYYADGTLDTVTDARGGVTKHANYDATGYPKTITDAMSKSTTFEYDVRGNVIRVKDPLLRETTAQYDEFGRPTAVTTPFNGAETRTTATEYDLNDNVKKETAPNGAFTAHAYGDADNVLETSLPDNDVTGRKIKYEYDLLLRLTKETAPKGVASAELGDFETNYSYDRIGQLLKVETPFKDADGSTKTPKWTYEYDSVGNKVKEIDPKGNIGSMVYDSNHRVTAVIDAAGYTSKNTYDADGLLIAEIDALGNKRTTAYDKAGQRTSVTVPHTPNGESASVNRITKWEYDPVGNVTKEIRPSGKFAETVYDANNRPKQKKNLFIAGDPDYPSPSSTFLEYYDSGELKRQSEPTFGTSGSQWTDFTYFDSGEPKTSTDPWKITATFEYNQIGKQTRRTLSAEGDTSTRAQTWGYNPDGSLASRSDTEAREPVDIADNVDLWQATATGTWSTVSGGTNTQGSNYRTHAAASGSTDKFTWKVTPDVTGSFDVLVSCPVRSDATTAATYTINHANGSSSKTVDQKACTSANPWVDLGNYSFTGGTTKTVELKPSASGVVVADAVKIVSTSEPAARTFSYAYDANGAQTEVKDNTPGALTDSFRSSYDGLGRTSQVLEFAGTMQKRKTDYTYDLNSNVLSTNATRATGSDNFAATRFTGYTWDVRNMVDTVKSGTTSATTSTWAYTYDARRALSTLDKPNGNRTTVRYHEDGLPRSLVERTSSGNGSKLVSSHTLKYTLDGDRSEDVEKVDKAGVPGTEFLDQVSRFAYTPARQLKSVTRTGADKGDNESYVYDAAGNIKSQTIGSTTSTMTYDRNRLTKTVTGSTTMNHRYDVFGRSTTVDVGSTVVQRNSFDGYDRLIRQQKFKTDGSFESLKSTKYDAFDRTSWQATKVGSSSAPPVQTRFVYLGLQDQIAVEEQTNTADTYEVSKVYTHGPGGQKLAVVDTPVNGSTTKTHYYGHNPHSDVETLTDTTGQTTSTYRYTAYGSPDKKGTTGEDAITGTPAADAEVVNPYRFNGKRFDGATGTYDMGFREYDPGLNRFLTRDMYNGALADMSLGTDPWTVNRYAFAGGNPTTGVELDGHEPCAESAQLAGACGVLYDSYDDASSDSKDDYNLWRRLSDYEQDAAEGGIDPTEYRAYKAEAGDPKAIQQMQGIHTNPRRTDINPLEFLAEMTGLADLGRCIGDGDVVSCVSIIPIFKPAKALKLVDGTADAGKTATKHGDEAASLCRVGAKSFSGDTKVLMADGSTKPISKVKVGDKVLATDPETGEQRVETVKRVFVHRDTVIDLVVNGEVITTTEDHPFWSVTDQKFERADQLAPGELVLTATGRTLRVGGLRAATSRQATAYNLEITNIHTYHVGDHEVLVHNVCDVSAVATKFGGEAVEGGFRFTNKKAAMRAASEMLGNMGSSTRAIRARDYRGGTWQMRNSDKVIGRESADGTVGYRVDFLGHNFGDGASMGPHVNIWSPTLGSKIHLFY